MTPRSTLPQSLPSHNFSRGSPGQYIRPSMHSRCHSADGSSNDRSEALGSRGRQQEEGALGRQRHAVIDEELRLPGLIGEVLARIRRWGRTGRTGWTCLTRFDRLSPQCRSTVLQLPLLVLATGVRCGARTGPGGGRRTENAPAGGGAQHWIGRSATRSSVQRDWDRDAQKTRGDRDRKTGCRCHGA